jgi:hypothetical protein
VCYFIKEEKSYKCKETVNTLKTLEHFTQQLNTTSTTTPSLRSLPLKELLKIRSPSQSPHVGFNIHLSKDHLRLRLNSIEHACISMLPMLPNDQGIEPFLKIFGDSSGGFTPPGPNLARGIGVWDHIKLKFSQNPFPYFWG